MPWQEIIRTNFAKEVRLNNERALRRDLWAEFIRNYKRSIWYAKSDTRRFLEEQFEKYENLGPASADYSQSPEMEEELMDADEYLQAPPSYKKEYWEIFKSLPPVMRRYLYERESEIERAFSRLNNELQAKRFLDEAFSTKGCRHGFKSARDWIEKLIFAEEMLEASPRETLRHLAKAYGVESDFAGKTDHASEISEFKIALLTEGLRRLQQRFDERERRYAETAAAAEAARKAKAAGFSPQGKSGGAGRFGKPDNPSDFGKKIRRIGRLNK